LVYVELQQFTGPRFHHHVRHRNHQSRPGHYQSRRSRRGYGCARLQAQHHPRPSGGDRSVTSSYNAIKLLKGGSRDSPFFVPKASHHPSPQPPQPTTHPKPLSIRRTQHPKVPAREKGYLIPRPAFHQNTVARMNCPAPKRPSTRKRSVQRDTDKRERRHRDPFDHEPSVSGHRIASDQRSRQYTYRRNGDPMPL
jgi:hypothetical protein